MERGDLTLGLSKHIVIFKTPNFILGDLELIVSFIKPAIERLYKSRRTFPCLNCQEFLFGLEEAKKELCNLLIGIT